MTGAAETAKAAQLIEQIHAANDAEIATLRAEAAEAASEIVSAAHARARQRVAREIVELRRERARAIDYAAAQIETARRHIRQTHERQTIERMAPVLAEILARFWRSEETRRAWSLNAVEQAADRLLPGPWIVEHPGVWTSADASAVSEAIVRVTGVAPDFTEDVTLTAGLRLRAGAACLDASDAALLADPQEVGARLLAAAEDQG